LFAEDTLRIEDTQIFDTFENGVVCYCLFAVILAVFCYHVVALAKLSCCLGNCAAAS